MNNCENCYEWTLKDKGLYIFSLIPFIALISGTIFLLRSFSMIVTLIWIILYVIINIFQAGCCIGCPYRGRYCPAFVGVYLGNRLSALIYKNRKFNAVFFKRNAMGGEITLTLFLLFPLYWIIRIHWYLAIIYVVLIVLHILLFMPMQCPKCSYNETCPGGKAYSSYRKLLKRK